MSFQQVNFLIFLIYNYHSKNKLLTVSPTDAWQKNSSMGESWDIEGSRSPDEVFWELKKGSVVIRYTCNQLLTNYRQVAYKLLVWGPKGKALAWLELKMNKQKLQDLTHIHFLYTIQTQCKVHYCGPNYTYILLKQSSTVNKIPQH